MTGRLVIVGGLPGSGKTTVARELAEARGGVRLSPDDWMDALGVSLWDQAARQRVESLQWTLTQDLVRAGATVVIEWGTWSRSERDSLRDGARRLGAAVELHHLDVPVDELWRRISTRNREDPPISRSDLERWATEIEPPDADERALFDAPP